MSKKIGKITISRSFFILVIFTFLWLILIGRLLYLQIFKYEDYQKDAVENITRETSVTPQRGTIYDSQMRPLATNATVWRVFLSPRDIETKEEAELIASTLSEILDVDYDMILKKTAMKNRQDETIKKEVEKEPADLIRAFIKKNGFETKIHLAAGSKRYYPYDVLASHVLGFTNIDGQGLSGLELTYDPYLRGMPGRYITAKNALGKNMPFKYESYIEAQNGMNVVSTLDMMIQRMLERQLEATWTESKAQNRVTGIIMEVDTGNVLAMGTYPNFDLNNRSKLDDFSAAKLAAYPEGSEEYKTAYNTLVNQMWNNKAVTELYEPGSTFKIVTSSMGLEEKVVKLSDMFTCTGTFYIPGYNKPVHCHLRSGHGAVTFERGLQQSCNPTLMMLADRIGKEKFYDYFKAFGYTERTGIDLNGEAMSFYHAYKDFNQVELAVYSFGQTFKVTPIQQLTAICAVANGGYLVTPRLVKELVDEDYNVIETFEPVIKRQVVSKETCDTLIGVLERGVATDGGAKNAYVKGYRVAAKTGTSEKRDVLNEAGESYLRVGSCVAFAPADDPKIAVLIMVDEPTDISYGSIVAAPYVAKVLDDVLSYLGVEKQFTEAELASMEVNVVDYRNLKLEDVKKEIAQKGIQFEIMGEGDTVLDQIPKGGSQLSKDTGKIILYTGDAKPEEAIPVPNVMGQTAKIANKTLVNKGFNVKLEGAINEIGGSSAVVFKQKPEADTLAPYGTVVTIELRHLDGTD